MIRLHLDSFHVNDYVSIFVDRGRFCGGVIMVKDPENRKNIAVKVNGMCGAFHVFVKRACYASDWMMSDVDAIGRLLSPCCVLSTS